MKKIVLSKSIKQIAGKIHENFIQAINYYSQEVEMIIASESKDKHRIEKALEGMLDFCCDEEMLTIYRRLCKYYYMINPTITIEYINAYRAIWDPDSKRFRKRKDIMAKWKR